MTRIVPPALLSFFVCVFCAVSVFVQPPPPANPQTAGDWRRTGVARQKAKDFDGAIRAYAKSLELEPNNPRTLYNLATAYALKHDGDRAFELMTQIKATRRLDMSQIEVDEDLKALRADARFRALLPVPADFE